jgi:hypothetical protein
MAGRFGKYGDAKRKAHLRRKGKTGNTIPKTREDRRQCSPKKKIKDQEENRMEARSGITVKERKRLDRLFQDKGYADYKWIDPHKIIVSQWVRMKCMFGCGEYGNNACCPPNVPSVSECERFFHEYQDAVIFRFEKAVAKPENRHKWSKNGQLLYLCGLCGNPRRVQGTKIRPTLAGIYGRGCLFNRQAIWIPHRGAHRIFSGDESLCVSNDPLARKN